MNQTVVYYEFEPIMGVHTTYHDGIQFHYDRFSSMYLFNIWVQCELSGCKTVEITDDNYKVLKAKGLI